MKKPLKLMMAALVLVGVCTVVLGYYVYNEFVHNPASSHEIVVIYEVKPGHSFTEIARDLESQGIIKNAHFFNILAKLTNERSKVKAGEYEFKSTMLPSTVLSILTSGKSIFKRFTVQEGLSMYEIAHLYQSLGFGSHGDFMKLMKDNAFIKSLLGPEATTEKIETLEGYLFPETYQITKFTTTRELVTNMVQTFLKQYETISKGFDLPAGFNRHKVVTLASIIEKETGASFERGKIASVFFNRMKRGMKLQTDPTIIYGKAELTGEIEIKISKEDLSTPTRYNTYVISGLPPGPIANPGQEAIRAVFQPESTPYLYFVSKNDGTQVFSTTYEDHNKAVQKYQVDPKAREGKSWRDLKTRGSASGPSPNH